MNPFRATRAHLTGVWLLLVFATAFAWWLVEKHSVGAHLASSAALLIAAFKVRLVFLHFMELRSAPLPWRIAFEAWVVFFFGIILAGYWL